MDAGSPNFFISNNRHEFQGVSIGGRRWIIGSSVGRALGIPIPKTFAKTLLRKPLVKAWSDNFVANGIAMSRDDQIYAIQRRVLSVEMTIYCTAHMRVSETQLSIYKMLMSLYRIGYDLGADECSMEKIKHEANKLGIVIS